MFTTASHFINQYNNAYHFNSLHTSCNGYYIENPCMSEKLSITPEWQKMFVFKSDQQSCFTIVLPTSMH